jgi:hypothetical protein
MSEQSGSRAAEIAAQQVESIVAAAQAAAEGIRTEALRHGQKQRSRAEQEADSVRAEARRDAAREIEQARQQAERLGEIARKEADQLREQTRRAIEGRVAAAEQAADDVLAEARALSSGLRRLAQVLGDQAERILRDIQTAHKRMRGDLRIPLPEASDGSTSRRQGEPFPRHAERAGERGSAPSPERPSSPASQGPRANPLDDLEVPSWIGPEP